MDASQQLKPMTLQDLQALQAEEGLEAQQVRMTRTQYHVNGPMSQGMHISRSSFLLIGAQSSVSIWTDYIANASEQNKFLSLALSAELCMYRNHCMLKSILYSLKQQMQAAQKAQSFLDSRSSLFKQCHEDTSLC